MQYQKEDVRNRIVESAKTEFLRVGYFRTSMLQISNKAHVPIGNLYRYFSSKASLFDAIVGTAKERIVESFMIGLGTTVDGSVSDVDYTSIINVATDNFLELVKNYQKEIRILLEKSTGSAYDGFIDEIIGYVRDLLKNRLSRLYKEENEFILSLIAENVTRGAFRIMIERPYEEQRNDLKRLLTFYFSNIDERLN